MDRTVTVNKNGNIMLVFLPIAGVLIIIILTSLIFLYIQISVQIYGIKSNIFYLVQSSIINEDFQKMAYRDYSLDTSNILENLNTLLQRNYLKVDNKKVGIVSVKCTNVTVLTEKDDVVKHTKGKYKVPIICVNINIKFTPIMSFLGREIKFNIHDDIKLSLLEFN